jgi:hypothetical protein
MPAWHPASSLMGTQDALLLERGVASSCTALERNRALMLPCNAYSC